MPFNFTLNPELPLLRRTGYEYIFRAEKNKVPETKNIKEGEPSRNITRKHDHDPNKWVKHIYVVYVALRIGLQVAVIFGLKLLLEDLLIMHPILFNW